MTHRRKGMALVQVIMAMSVAIAIVGVLAATMSKMIQAGSESREHLQTVVNLGRLGEQFRRDVHEAHAATIAHERSALLELTGDAGFTVRYEITPHCLQRVATRSGKSEHREQFVLPGMTLVGWEKDETHREVALVVKRLARRDAENEGPRGQFLLSAVLARSPSLPPAPPESK